MLRLTQEKYLLENRGFVYQFWSSVDRVDIHKHEYFEFFIIKNGSAMHTINGIVQELSSNTLGLIRPNDCHMYNKRNNQPFSMYNIMVAKKNIEKLFSYLGDNTFLRKMINQPLPPMVHLSPEEIKNVVLNISNLSSLPVNSPERHTIHRLILSFFFYKLMLNDTPTTQTHLPDWLNQTTLLMKEKTNFSEGLPALIRYSGKSHEFVCRSFQKYFHCSPSDYINQIRIKHAEFLLMSTSMPVIDIALECGFNSISHFNHVFKKMLSVSPTQYRQKNKMEIPDKDIDPRAFSSMGQN